MCKWHSFLVLGLVLLAMACQSSGNKSQEEPSSDFTPRDLSAIKESDTINVITLYSSMSYFLYKGEPMGYEYELLKDFADAEKLKINIKIAPNINRLTEMLLNGEGDLIMYNIPITNDGKTRWTYCGREVITQQVLVQRSNRSDTILTDVTELRGREVWVKHDTKYHDRLKNLNNELGGGIIIQDILQDTINTEDLIELVAKGKISYTVSDDNIAQLNKTYHSNINNSLLISHPQRSSWAVQQNCPELAVALNLWFANRQNTERYRAIIKRYFETSKSPAEESVRELGSLYGGGQISPYDSLFRQHASEIQKEWQLIAAVSYQESRFDTTGVSWAGAVGLMGLMPGTAKAMGIDVEQRTNPEASIKAGSAYLQLMYRSFKSITNEEERIKFMLAAYNAGIGHVLDARALTRKYGKDPEIWDDNVEEYIRLKSNPEYYNDSICKHGYLRGSETVSYVKDIMRRWYYYREKVQ